MKSVKAYLPQIIVILIAVTFMYLMYTFWRETAKSAKSDLESLFAGWAFVGLIATVILQSIELHFQRKELEDTREVLTRTADAQEKSEVALARQINAMNQATLVNGYTALLEYYDKGGRTSSQPERDQADHVRARIKQVIDNVEAEQGWSGTFGPRPVDWQRI